MGQYVGLRCIYGAEVSLWLHSPAGAAWGLLGLPCPCSCSGGGSRCGDRKLVPSDSGSWGIGHWENWVRCGAGSENRNSHQDAPEVL